MRSNGEGSSPSQPHNAVLLGKKLSSRSASLHPEALNGTGEPSQKLALEMTKNGYPRRRRTRATLATNLLPNLNLMRLGYLRYPTLEDVSIRFSAQKTGATLSTNQTQN